MITLVVSYGLSPSPLHLVSFFPSHSLFSSSLNIHIGITLCLFMELEGTLFLATRDLHPQESLVVTGGRIFWSPPLELGPWGPPDPGSGHCVCWSSLGPVHRELLPWTLCSPYSSRESSGLDPLIACPPLSSIFPLPPVVGQSHSATYIYAEFLHCYQCFAFSTRMR